jgi:hypothetical protein
LTVANNPSTSAGDMFPRLHHLTHTLHETLGTKIATITPRLRDLRAPITNMSSNPAPSSASFDALHDTITAALLATTRAATALAAEDLRFHRSLDAGLAADLAAQQRRILTLARRLLASAARGSGADAPPAEAFGDVDALEDAWAGVVDVVDGELERADVALDEMAGVVKTRGGGQEAGGVNGPVTTGEEVCIRLYVLARGVLMNGSRRGAGYRGIWTSRSRSCSSRCRRITSRRSRSGRS